MVMTNETTIKKRTQHELEWSVWNSSAQKMELSIKDFFSKCDQIRGFLRIWSYLVKKFIVENFIFCAVVVLNCRDINIHCTLA